MPTDRPRIKPLPLRVVPLPWEDLHSFLVRTAQRMLYPTITYIIQPEISPHHIASSQISLLAEQSDYTLLSDLLLISEDSLYQMTLHRFSATFEQLDFFLVSQRPHHPPQYLQPRTIPYHSPIQKPRLEIGLLRSFFLPNLTTQICPLCLQEGVAYDRLYWKTRFLLTCHKHAVLLLRRCPSCGNSIPSNRQKLTSCPFCHRAYHNCSGIPASIPPEACCLLSGDLLTLRALGVSPLPTHPSFCNTIPDPRHALPACEYFALLRAICISLHPLQAPDLPTFLPPAFLDFLLAHKITHHPRPDQVPPVQTAIAHWIFAAWPHHFFSFLHALEQWSWRAKKRHAFSYFPEHFLLAPKAIQAHLLLSSAYKQFWAIPARDRHPPFALSSSPQL